MGKKAGLIITEVRLHTHEHVCGEGWKGAYGIAVCPCMENLHGSCAPGRMLSNPVDT